MGAIATAGSSYRHRILASSPAHTGGGVKTLQRTSNGGERERGTDVCTNIAHIDKRRQTHKSARMQAHARAQGEREREREADRQADRQRGRERERKRARRAAY